MLFFDLFHDGCSFALRYGPDCNDVPDMALIPSNFEPDQGGLMRGLRMLAAGMLVLMALSGCTAMTGETLGQNIDDTNITAAVKTKLATGEKASTLTRIDVDTVRGVVSLNGVVATDQE